MFLTISVWLETLGDESNQDRLLQTYGHSLRVFSEISTSA